MKELIANINKNVLLYSDNKLITEVTTKNNPKQYLNTTVNGCKIDDFIVWDTTQEQIKEIPNIYIQGLYFLNDNKGKKQPNRVYFGIQIDTTVNGLAYCHYNNGLCPVFVSTGERLRIVDLCNVIANFDGSKLYDFRQE